MASRQYISDNPFRLLRIGSSTSQTELRQAATADKFGVGHEAALAAVYSSEEQDRCADVVGSLANDPELRTIYRLFWPFDFRDDLGACDTLDAFDRLPDAFSDSRSFRRAQRSFLSGWFRFTVTPDPKILEQTLDSFAAFCDDADSDPYLRSLLIADGVDPNVGLPVVYDAQKRALNVVLSEGCGAALDSWAARDYVRTSGILKVVINSGYDADVIVAALLPVVAAGDREMAAIQAAMAADDSRKQFDISIVAPSLQLKLTGHGRQIKSVFDIGSVEALHNLARAMNGSTPASVAWFETVECRFRQIVGIIQEHSVAPEVDGDTLKYYLTVLARIRALPLRTAFRAEIELKLPEIEGNVHARESFNGFSPVENRPALGTVRGMGFELYGRTQIPERPDWYITTQYAVLFYVPIFPVKRFLVSESANGGLIYYGQTGLSRANRIHLVATVALVVVLLPLWISHANRAAPPESSESGTPAVPATSPSDRQHEELGRAFIDMFGKQPAQDSDGNAESSAPERSAAINPKMDHARRVRLEAEYHKLEPIITAEAAELTKLKDRLDEAELAMTKDVDSKPKDASDAYTDEMRQKYQRYQSALDVYDKKQSAYDVISKRFRQVDSALNPQNN